MKHVFKIQPKIQIIILIQQKPLKYNNKMFKLNDITIIIDVKD